MCVLTSDIYTFKIYFMKIFYLLLVVNTVQCCKNEFNLSECPLRNGEQWNQKDTVCAEKDPSHVFHCQTDNNREVTGHCSLCAKPEKCPPGTYPSLHNVKVSCLQCVIGTYQSTAKPSNEFIVTGCEETHQECTKEQQYECKPGSKITERLCACDNERSFKPGLTEGADCTCFARNDGCTCSFDACGEGKQMNRSYQCEPVPVTSTTRDSPVTTLSYLNTESQPPEEIKQYIIPIVVSVVCIAVIVIGIGYCLKKKIRPNRAAESDNPGCNFSFCPRSYTAVGRTERIEGSNIAARVTGGVGNNTTAKDEERLPSSAERQKLKGDTEESSEAHSKTERQYSRKPIDQSVQTKGKNIVTVDSNQGNIELDKNEDRSVTNTGPAGIIFTGEGNQGKMQAEINKDPLIRNKEDIVKDTGAGNRGAVDRWHKRAPLAESEL